DFFQDVTGIGLNVAAGEIKVAEVADAIVGVQSGPHVGMQEAANLAVGCCDACTIITDKSAQDAAQGSRLSQKERNVAPPRVVFSGVEVIEQQVLGQRCRAAEILDRAGLIDNIVPRNQPALAQVNECFADNLVGSVTLFVDDAARDQFVEQKPH